MGHKHSKLEAVIGSSYTCPSCQEIFKPDTPFEQFQTTKKENSNK